MRSCGAIVPPATAMTPSAASFRRCLPQSPSRQKNRLILTSSLSRLKALASFTSWACASITFPAWLPPALPPRPPPLSRPSLSQSLSTLPLLGCREAVAAGDQRNPLLPTLSLPLPLHAVFYCRSAFDIWFFAQVRSLPVARGRDTHIWLGILPET